MRCGVRMCFYIDANDPFGLLEARDQMCETRIRKQPRDGTTHVKLICSALL